MDLGTIDTRIYSCISPDIATNQVIITDEQLDHIAAHHPEAYDETLIWLKSTLASPDYILADTKHDNSGLVICAIPSSNNHLFIVLRICTNTMGGKYANTVISGWKISSKRLQNYLKSQPILYKRK